MTDHTGLKAVCMHMGCFMLEAVRVFVETEPLLFSDRPILLTTAPSKPYQDWKALHIAVSESSLWGEGLGATTKTKTSKQNQIRTKQN